MTVALDANILLRLIDATADLRPIAVAAVDRLVADGHRLVFFPQTVTESWAVATRPSGPPANGLGMTPAECRAEIDQYLDEFSMMPDHQGLFKVWYQLVIQFDCKGKTAHDAKYVAAMMTHNITDLMTFNTSDFQRYPHMTVHDPKKLTAAP